MSNSRELSQLADLITIDDNTRNIGFSTLTNIGIGTSSPNHKLNVGGNANITGIISASTFVGSASGLTNVPAGSIVGTLPQLDGSNLINLVGLGTGVNIRSSNSPLGTASTINFGDNINVTFSSGISTISINLIGYANTAGIATYATNAGIATYATSSGIATYATNAGIATYATSSGIATYSTTAGIATYATYATTAGIATYATSSGIATYSTTAGIASALTSTTSINTSGIITSSSFSGSGANLTGIVNSIVAGTNITINNSSGQVTVNSTANTNITINDDTSSSSPLYLTAVSNTSGTVQGLSVSSTRLSFIPSTGTLTSTKFSGNGESLTSLSATNLTSGTIPDARFPATLPAASGANLTSLSATNLTSGTIPDARFPATLPAASGANLTNLNAANLTNLSATNLTSGTIPDARFPATLPAASGANLTNLNPSNLSNGTITATSFIKSGGGTSSQFLKADGSIDSSSYITLSTNYIQSGTNAAPRSIQSKLSDVVSVKDFGAAGTGSSDDTDSIQYAVTYAALNGKCVYFPAGIYPIYSTISTTLSGDKSISFLGDGVGVSIIRLNPGGNSNGIEINLPGEWWLSGVPGSGSNGFSMRGLTFETQKSPGDNSSGIKIIGDSFAGRPERTIVISEIEFQARENPNYGFKKWLHIVRKGDTKISDCNFRLDYSRQGTGIHIDDGTNTPNNLDDGGGANNSTSTIQITNTDFIMGNKSIEMTDFFEGLYVTNCGFVGPNYGIFCNDTGAESGMNLSNSHLNCELCCVYLKGMCQSNISNNLIYANGGSGSIGIELLGNSGEYVITGNSIINLGSANYGIVIDGYNLTSPPHQRSSLIAANYIKGFAQYGIWIKGPAVGNPASGAKYLKVGDNHIWDTGVGQILKQSSDYISIFKQQFLESFVLNLTGTTEQIHDMAIPSSVFRVAPLLGIIQCNTDSRVLCRLNDGSTTSTNARIVITMIGGGNLPTGAHRFSVILSHLGV